ncbi:MAG: hypothetical protein J6A01_05480 [Proteobacteria bacterium]|nr:hypothetical protein [Pseudomonadota bacterium]
MRKTSLLIAMALLAMGFSGCSEEADSIENYGVNPEYTVTKAALNANCSIAVQGYGTVQMETDYVPNVTWCENGNAPDEALKAQSAAARTFAYYKISTGGTPVQNSQGDQVYKCESRAPSTAQLNRCKDATNATSGYVMMYKGTVTAGFYVSGVTQTYLNSECKPTVSSGQTGWVGVQSYVTYNWGKSGNKANGFTQTTLGWVNDGNYANRGCMAQNGASCLANNGWKWDNILKYFYGADIELTKASGSCVLDSSHLSGEEPPETPKCTTVLDKSGVIIDEQDPCFSRSATDAWWDVNAGYNNHLFYTYVWAEAAEAIGTWTVNVTRPGTYEVFAYIQSGVGAVSEKAPYTIRASGKESKININLQNKSGWVSLGKFTFAKGGDQWVKLDDASGEPYTDKNGKRVLFDAIKFEDAVSCTDACTNGAKQCSGNGVQVCSKGSDGCTAWGSVTACASDETCKGGVCEKNPITCNNTCAAADMRECSGTGYHICTKDANGCLAWSGVTPCGDNQKCSNGACIEDSIPCTSTCTANSMQCSGNGVIKCDDYNGDGCYEWGTQVIPCGEDEHCNEGACVPNDSQPPVNPPDTPDPPNPPSDELDTNGIPAECLTEIAGQPSVIIDDQDACFVRSDSKDWSELASYGYQSHLYYANVSADSYSAIGTWYLKVTKAGKYTLSVYIDSGIGNLSSQVVYTVRASDNLETYLIKTANASGWVKLTDVDLSEGGVQYIQLNNSGSSADISNRIVYDAIKVEPYSEENHVDEPGVTDPDAKPDKPGNEDPGDNNKPGGSTDPSVRVSAESDCSGTPIQNQSAPLSILMCGILGCMILRRRRNI